MIYFSSDYHFGHDKDFAWGGPRNCTSVEDNSEKIISRHNAIVKDEDDVYVNGSNLLDGRNNDKVIIGGFSIVSILNTKTYRVEISIVDDRIKMIHSLIRINNGKIVCGCHGGRLCLIGENGIIEYIKDCSQSDTVYSLVNVDENMFISGSWDKTIKIWKY